MEDYRTYYCKQCKEYFHINIIPKTLTRGARSYDFTSFTCPKCGFKVEETKMPNARDYAMPKKIKQNTLEKEVK